MFVIETIVTRCSLCDGSGWYRFSGMGSDNMDIWEDTDTCPSCDGHQIDEAEDLIVDLGDDIDPV